MGGFAIFAVMTLLQRMDNRMHRSTKVFEVYLELEDGIALGDLLRQLRAMDLEVRDVQRETDNEEGVRAYTATLKAQKRKNHIELLNRLRDIKGVSCVEEL